MKTRCSICGTQSENLTIGSDGETTACQDCMGDAESYHREITDEEWDSYVDEQERNQYDS